MNAKSNFNSDKVQELKDVLKGKKDHSDEGDAAYQGDEETLKGEDNASSLSEAKIAELTEELKKQKESYLRLLAEFENFKKRMERESGENIKYANEKLIKEFLPVLDHLEMSLTAVAGKPLDEKLSQSLLDGVGMTVRQFVGVLEKCGIKVVEGEGAPFNPNFQESISMVDSDAVAPGNVVTVHRKGFVLNDRLVRAALVSVAKEK